MKRITSAHVLAIIAIVMAMSGTAWAAATITGKQIKKETITSANLKNGTVAEKDLTKAVQQALKKAGTPGPAGRDGQSITGPQGIPGSDGQPGKDGQSIVGPKGDPGSDVFATTAPSGTQMQGILVAVFDPSSTSAALRNGASYPVPVKNTPAIRVNPGSFAASVDNGFENTTSCGGTADAPNVSAGYTCLYLTDVSGVASDSIQMYAGSTAQPESLGDRMGFYFYAAPAAVGVVTVRGIWVTKAS